MYVCYFEMYKSETNDNSKLFIFVIIDVELQGVYDLHEYLSCFVIFLNLFIV